MSFFVDTTVPLLAVGRDGPERTAARAFLRQAAQSHASIHFSVEAVQEYVFHRTRWAGRGVAIAEGRRLADVYVLHDLTVDVQAHSLDLMEQSPIRGRDAIHAATALLAGFTEIVTADRDFDGVPGLLRRDPADI